MEMHTLKKRMTRLSKIKFITSIVVVVFFAHTKLHANEPLVDWSKTKLYLRPSFSTVPANSELLAIEELNLLPFSLVIKRKEKLHSFRVMPILGLSDYDETQPMWGRGVPDFIRPNMQNFPLKTLGVELSLLYPLYPALHKKGMVQTWYVAGNYAIGYHREYIYTTHKISGEIGRFYNKKNKNYGLSLELGFRYRFVNTRGGDFAVETFFPTLMPKFFIGI